MSHFILANWSCASHDNVIWYHFLLWLLRDVQVNWWQSKHQFRYHNDAIQQKTKLYAWKRPLVVVKSESKKLLVRRELHRVLDLFGFDTSELCLNLNQQQRKVLDCKYDECKIEQDDGLSKLNDVVKIIINKTGISYSIWLIKYQYVLYHHFNINCGMWVYCRINKLHVHCAFDK